jgi:hypothetical protein
MNTNLTLINLRNVEKIGSAFSFVLAFATILIFNFTSPAQSILTCPTPVGTTEEQNPFDYPYRISYGFRVTDRSYADEKGISKETGTLVFVVGITPEIEVRVGNQNFAYGKDATGMRAVNFGNSSFGITYAPNKLQESNSWQKEHFYPSLSFDYEATLPTGSRSRGLNVGRVDHDFTLAVEKKIGQKLRKTPETFIRRTSVEADFGLSLSANEGGGYGKSGNVVLVVSRILDNIKTKKYGYSGEISFQNLARHEKTIIKTLNSLKINFAAVQLKMGLIAGLNRATTRVGLNISATFNGSFKKSN